MNASAAGTARPETLLRIALPVLVLALGIVAWHLVVEINGIPPYVLPGPDEWGTFGSVFPVRFAGSSH